MSKAEEKITKKIAALELFKVHKRVQNLGAVTILAGFIASLTTVLNQALGASVAGVISMIAAYFIVVSRKSMIYLNETYNLGFKTKQK